MSLNTIFCSFDEFECIWAEALQTESINPIDSPIRTPVIDEPSIEPEFTVEPNVITAINTEKNYTQTTTPHEDSIIGTINY